MANAILIDKEEVNKRKILAEIEARSVLQISDQVFLNRFIASPCQAFSQRRRAEKRASSEIANERKTVGREKVRGPESIFSNTPILPLPENPFLWSKCQMSNVSPSHPAVFRETLPIRLGALNRLIYGPRAKSKKKLKIAIYSTHRENEANKMLSCDCNEFSITG